MKKKYISFFILITICAAFFACEGMAVLFHGPKPEETYTVTFNANGANGTVPAAQTVNNGTVIRLPDKGGLTSTGNVFVGWSENASGSGSVYSVGAFVTVTQNMVFYAQWLDGSTPQYTVTFNANGATSGSPPAAQTAYSGISITVPGQGTLVYSGKNFGGWNTQSNGGGTNYIEGAAYTVTGNVTLYAKWGSAPVDPNAIVPPGDNLAEQLAYIASNAGDGVVYDIVVNNDVYMEPTTVATMGRNIIVNISSASPADVKTIQLEGQGHLFSVDTGITMKLQDIVLMGHSNNNKALVAVGNGTLILNSGAKITQNTNNSGDNRGGGVHVNGGVLELNEDSEILGNNVISVNTAGYGGGIYAENRSSIIIRGGTINENVVSPTNMYSGAYGGGIYITGNSTVTMSGGIISKNNLPAGLYAHGERVGGGIYVDSDSSFIKRATPPGSSASGIIYGGGTGNYENTASWGGHAIYRNWGTLRERNTTLGGYDEISTGNDVGWE